MINTLVPDSLMLPGEVAALFRVDSKTVRRWEVEGKLTARKTMGGHRRYLESEIRAALGLEEKTDA